MFLIPPEMLSQTAPRSLVGRLFFLGIGIFSIGAGLALLIYRIFVSA